MSTAYKVFLGGTCGNNPWRRGFIDRMRRRGFAPGIFFDPVVAHWDEAAQRREDLIKRMAQYVLFYLGNPMQPGSPLSYYSLIEAVMAKYDHGGCVAVFDVSGLQGHARQAMLKALTDLRGRFPYAPIFESLNEAEDWLAGRLR